MSKPRSPRQGPSPGRARPARRRLGLPAWEAAAASERSGQNLYSLCVWLPGPDTSAGPGGCLHSWLGSAPVVSVLSLSRTRRERHGGAGPGRCAGCSPPSSARPRWRRPMSPGRPRGGRRPLGRLVARLGSRRLAALITQPVMQATS